MSLSKEARTDNMNEALGLMLDQLGDHAIYGVSFNPADHGLCEIVQTTWAELAGRTWISRFGVAPLQYQLTGDGWYGALRVTGRLSQPDFRERMSTLQAGLKDCVKGRTEPALVGLDGVAGTCGLSQGWVLNAIEANLLGREFSRVSARWARTHKRCSEIYIPVDFGMEPLS